MTPSPELDAALRQHEQRESIWRAESAAEPDPGLQSYRVLKFLTEHYGMKLGDVRVMRYPDAAAPGVNGFHFKGSSLIYLASSSGLRTALHEGLHLLRPALCEATVLKLAAYWERLLSAPADPVVSNADTRERSTEWDYSSG